MCTNLATVGKNSMAYQMWAKTCFPIQTESLLNAYAATILHLCIQYLWPLLQVSSHDVSSTLA